MKLILHDLKNEYETALLSSADMNIRIFSALPKVKPCTSCFGCWLKTPGMCVIEDRVQDYNTLMAKADELHIVSKLLYGGLSTEIKAVMDRSLGFILPYFDIMDGAMHHPPRYDKDLGLHYYIYDFDVDSMPGNEMKTMRGIARANARNYTAVDQTCCFFNDPNDLMEALK